MMLTDLHGVASNVVRRAERQGYIVPRDIRAELTGAGLPEDRWKEVVSLARPSLNYRNGRYYFIGPSSSRVQSQQDQRRTLQQAIGQLLEQYRARATDPGRRQEDRVAFVQSVQVHTEDGRELRLLSRDLSATGIRLIGTRSLLGQKVRITLPLGEGAETCVCLARILWTGAVGDGLFENGGSFLEVISPA